MRFGNRLSPAAATNAASPGKTYRNSEWVLLRAARTLPEDERPGSHVLELVSAAKEPTVGMVNNHGHAWVRLIEPDGRLYSAGFYPDESTGLSPERWPGLTFPGMLLNPDKWDRAGWHEVVTRYEVSREQFALIGNHLEGLQAGRHDGSLAFRLLDLNCVWLVAEVASLIGVEVDIEYSLAYHATRNLTSRLPSRIGDRSAFVDRLLRPRSDRSNRSSPTRLIANLVAAVAGGRSTFGSQWVRSGDVMTRREIDFDPMQRSPLDPFRKQVPFNHVIALQRWQLAKPARTELAAEPEPPYHKAQAGPPDRSENDATDTDSNVYHLRIVGEQSEPRQQTHPRDHQA